MRRLVLAIVLPLLLVATVAPWVPTPQTAEAQAASDVSLRLVSQTPWNTPDHPRFRMKVRATNLGAERVSDMGLAFVLHFPVISRTAYEESLQTSPPDSLLAPLAQEVSGSLAPGQSRILALNDLDLSFLSRYPNKVYPFQVDLRSGLETVATLRTAVVFLNFPHGQTRAEEPLRMSWAFVLHEPILFDADGAFQPGAVDSLLDPNGRLRRELDSLTNLESGEKPVPVDVVLSPTLVDQLGRLSGGYPVRDGSKIVRVPAGRGNAAVATQVLDQLEAIVADPSEEVSTMPFAAPDLPALLRSGLAGDLGALIRRGRDEVAGVTGAHPDTTLLRPLGSFLDQKTLFALSQEGFRLFLVDPDLVQRPPWDNGYAQPATAKLRVGAGAGETVTAAVPDPGVQSLLASDLPSTDPRLAAQAVLGELAIIWLEQPAVRRSITVSLPENLPLPAALFGPLVSKAAGAPWLAPRPLTTMAASFPPPVAPVRLTPRVGGRYPSWYVNELIRARARITTYRSMLVDPSPLPDQLEKTLFEAESADFTQDRSIATGRSFLDIVTARLRGEFGKIQPKTSTVVTLTSRKGVIPVGISNETGYAVHLNVRLVSNHLAIAADAQDVEIHGRSRTLLFHVQARTTGRFPVQVQIRTPSGVVLQAGQLVVRSTAYNLIALIITIGAAVFLLAWWGRRFLPRRKTS